MDGIKMTVCNDLENLSVLLDDDIQMCPKAGGFDR